MGDWRGLSCWLWWLKTAAFLANLSGMVQEVLLPYLGQTVIDLRCSAPTANNQLRSAYFFTIVIEPVTLSQLCASEQGSTNPEKVLLSLFLRVYSPLVLFFLFFPLLSFNYVYKPPFLCYLENLDFSQSLLLQGDALSWQYHVIISTDKDLQLSNSNIL